MPLNDGLKIVSPENMEFSKRAGSRPGDDSRDDDSNPEQLMELLGDIDTLKVEINERIRRMEAVKQAKSVLMEDALRTEALSKKLAELGKIMSEAPLGALAGLEQDLGLNSATRLSPHEDRDDAEARQTLPRVAAEGVALPWPKSEEVQILNEPGVVSERVDSAIYQAKEFVTPAVLEDRFEEISTRIAGTEDSWRALRHEFEQITEEARHQYEAKELVASAAREGRFEEISTRIAGTEDSGRALRHEFEQITEEVRRQVVEINQRVGAFDRDNQTAQAELRQLQDTVRQAIEALEDRVAHAEENLRRSEQNEAEAKRLLEESTEQLRSAAQVEQETTARILATEASFKSNVDSATQRLNEAEQFWKQKDQSVTDSKKQLEQATFALTQAHAKEESATADLVSARQELTTAYQFAAVAAQRRLDSSEFFRKAAFWAVLGTAFSWIGMVWAAWFSVRGWLPIWAPAAATVLIFALAASFKARSKREAEGD